MHKEVEPAILYVGTPVVLISTRNPDGSPNLAPMSSAWWLGWSCALGLDASSRTTENLMRTGECVLNLPSDAQAAQVDRLALLTGSQPVPPHKRFMGYRHETDKFGAAGLTALPSQCVASARVAECPIQLEAVLENVRPFAKNDPRMRIAAVIAEVRMVRIHVDESLLVAGATSRIDPLRWRPLIMNFRELFGIGPKLRPSRLAEFPEERFAPAVAGAARPGLAANPKSEGAT